MQLEWIESRHRRIDFPHGFSNDPVYRTRSEPYARGRLSLRWRYNLRYQNFRLARCPFLQQRQLKFKSTKEIMERAKLKNSTCVVGLD